MKCGAIVQLKSGGPAMTVTKAEYRVAGILIVETVWFGTNDICHHGEFTEELLTLGASRVK